jgi:phosphoglucosamine mutase
MSRKYFGTDGIRGKVGEAPMSVDFALRLASAAARVLAPKGGRVLVGKDTRLSGYMFEAALEAGFVAAGVDVLLAGPLPTPGIAYLVQRLECDFGAVISASHNRYDDNGIKFFDREGGKLADELEEAIESHLDELAPTRESAALGRATRVDHERGLYQAFCASTLPRGMRLDRLKLVIDCANGAAYKVGPTVLRELGAEVFLLGTEPNGRNINDGCGSLFPEKTAARVRELRADVGIALDGDADRAVLVCEKGNIVDGDALLALFARDMSQRGVLRGGKIVGTVMSNLGLERALAECGIGLLRTQVGDRYVVEAMRSGGCNLGGEQSGHTVFLDHNTTGDGLLTALQALAILRRKGCRFSELTSGFERLPQVLLGVRVAQKKPIESLPSVAAAVHRVEAALAGRGRVLIRYSGTEPKARIMVEGEDEKRVAEYANELADELRRALGAE